MRFYSFLAAAFLLRASPVIGWYKDSDAAFELAARGLDLDDLDFYARNLDVEKRGYLPDVDELWGRSDDELWERDLDLWERDNELWERDLDLWAREDDADEFALLSRRDDSAKAYDQLSKIHPMRDGEWHAFVLTFPLKKKAGASAAEKQLEAFQEKLGYNHKALLVGTASKKKFIGKVYDQTIESWTVWKTGVGHSDFKPGTSVQVEYKGPVKAGWTEATIVKAG